MVRAFEVAHNSIWFMFSGADTLACIIALSSLYQIIIWSSFYTIYTARPLPSSAFFNALIWIYDAMEVGLASSSRLMSNLHIWSHDVKKTSCFLFSDKLGVIATLAINLTISSNSVGPHAVTMQRLRFLIYSFGWIRHTLSKNFWQAALYFFPNPCGSRAVMLVSLVRWSAYWWQRPSLLFKNVLLKILWNFRRSLRIIWLTRLGSIAYLWLQKFSTDARHSHR